MQKNRTTVRIAGKEYTIASYDSEEYVNRVAAYVDRKLSETAAVTNLPSAQAAVLTCFNLAEELIRAQDENAVLRLQMQKANEK